MMSSLQSWYEEQSLAGSLSSSSLVKATAASSKNNSETSPPLPPPSSSSPSPYQLIVAAVGKGTGMTAMQAERFVGFSAVTGTAYVAMRMYMYAYNTLRGDDKNDGDSSTVVDPASPRQTRRVSHSILGVFRRTLRKILLDDSEYIARAPSTIKDDTAKAKEDFQERLVTHQGSCHCESIQFTIVAPPVIRAQDGPGKIHFRHVSVKASDFQVYAGFENMKTYYVAYRDSGDKGAHAFCERCGVHVLYAPSKSSPNVSINVRCLRDDESRKIKIISKKDGISNGIPVAGQFEELHADHLSTVSEVTQPFHFQMNYVNRQPSYELPKQSDIRRKQSDVSSIASPTSDEDLSLGIPIKQFYAPSTSSKHRRSTFSAGTASLTDQSSGSLYRGTVGSGRHSMLPPMSPARSNARSFGGIDEYSYESVSQLGDDTLSLTSARNGSIISLREKEATLRANNRTGGENLNAAGNPPMHPTVDRTKMKRFMSKYKKNKKVESSN